jgi:hypothetical protein
MPSVLALPRTSGRRAEAAEKLLTRVFGKPTETVKTMTEEPKTLEAIRGMSREERWVLLRKLEDEGRLRVVDGEGNASGGL